MTDAPAVPLAAFRAAAEACPFVNGDALWRALEAAAPLITAAERDRIRQFARETSAWVPGKKTGPMRSEPGRFFADLLEQP